MDREDTCHRTCFSLQLDGNVLDNFAELKSIEGLQEGSLLKVVEGQIRRLFSTLDMPVKINVKVTFGFFFVILWSFSRAVHCARGSHPCASHQRPSEKFRPFRRLQRSGL